MQSNVMKQVKSALIEVLNLATDTDVSVCSKLKDDLGLDSMSSLTFLMTLEENIEGFIVDPDNLEMSDLDTVGSISEYVNRQLGDEGSANTIQIIEPESFAQVAYA